MKSITQHQGVLKLIKRLDSSYFGNPRFLLSVGGFECITAVDAMLGYGVQNYDGREVNATIGTHYGKATLNTCEIATTKDLFKG